MEELPITEVSSQFTKELDRVEEGCAGLVRMLRQADGQLWEGFGPHPGFYDDSVIESIERLSECFRAVRDSHGKGSARTVAVLSGCGTSGRMAYFAAGLFNEYIPGARDLPVCHRPFRYLISGGDHSLVLSQELPEDDANAGVNDLMSCIEDLPDDTRIIVVGITCGISAPYVLGQLKHASGERRMVPVLIGFNPCHLARDSPVEQWAFTCRDIALELDRLSQERPKEAIVINPVIGPEAVTGSSRMKGGTATKIILETAFFLSFKDPSDTDVSVIDILNSYEAVHRCVYRPLQSIAKVLEVAGECLRQGGHIYYVGSGSVGRMGFIDASEMYDTYGEDFHSVRGFMRDGWTTANVNSGDLAEDNELLRLSWDHFADVILPNLTSQDLVIVCSTSSHCQDQAWAKSAVASLSDTPAHVVTLGVTARSKVPSLDGNDVTVILPFTDLSHIIESLAQESYPRNEPLSDTAVKYLFNAITTGACVVKGLVYSNRMINMGISNNKLYHRATRIVQEVCNVDGESANECLLMAIHGVEREEVRRRLAKDPQWALISHHVLTATPKPRVLPCAILLATKLDFSYADAHAALEAEPLLRAHIGRS